MAVYRSRKTAFCTWVAGQPKAWQIVTYYGILLGIVGISGEKCRKKGKRRVPHKQRLWKGCKREKWERTEVWKALACVGMLCLGILILGYRPRGKFVLTCLDVGQGDGSVIETPEGAHFLIDGGSSDKSGVGQYQILPFLKNQGISYLDGIFVSHTDGDHISGVKELLGFMGNGLTSVRAGKLILPDWEEKNEAWKELEKLAEDAGMDVIAVHEGEQFRSGSIRISVLSPAQGAKGADVNEEGMVLMVECGEFQGLFMGDVGETTEKRLIEEGKVGDVEFLKVGHHGSKNGSCEVFLETIMPEVGVISCGEGNRYGHPAEETLERLEKAGCRVWKTMECGGVRVEVEAGASMRASGVVRAFPSPRLRSPPGRGILRED